MFHENKGRNDHAFILSDRSPEHPGELAKLACVAWRFCRAGRPPSLLKAPNQNRHATQAIAKQANALSM